MRRGRTFLAAAAAVLACAAAAAGAATADTSTTCSNGSSVTAQGYCSPVTTPTSSTSTGARGGQTLSTSGVAGANTTVAAPQHATRQSGTLPFTGVQLTIFALVGLALLVGGFLLHTMGRRRGSDG